MPETTLATQSLTVRFDGVTALTDVSLSCFDGELTGLIGPNGAGKTTFIDAVTGFLPHHTRGGVALRGEQVLGRSPHWLCHRGLTRTWQTLELFDEITVRENLEVASRRLTMAGAVRDFFSPQSAHDRVDEVFDLLQIGHLARRRPSELSQGQRKVVGVARALAVESAQMLLLDEPAAGLDRSETQWFGEQLLRLKEGGISMLLVDHDMTLVFNVCDRINVLVFGELVAQGRPEDIRNDEVVVSAYLGHSGGAA